jgi:enoyl-CoA hydratase/carnithine racemase
MADKVVFEVEGPIAVISNNNPGKRNAFDDEMDVLLF